MIEKTIAIVIPVFNESGNIDLLCDRLGAVMGKLAEFRWKLIFVDDGSRDDTAAKLTARQAGGLPITVIRFTRNFGHQAAIKAGLDHADADAVVTMDGDLQHPPELIEQMLPLWQAGNLVVQTVRQRVETSENAARRRVVRCAYKIINWFAERPIPEECADFRLIDRQVLEKLKKMPEVTPMLRGLVAWVGFKQITLPYQVQHRAGGESRFTLRQLVNLLAGGIFDLSRKPLGFGTVAGAALTILGFLGWAVGLTTGLMFFIFFLAAVQLLALGLIGSYLGRAYNQTLNRPLYIVSEKVNFPFPSHCEEYSTKQSGLLEQGSQIASLRSQ
jgi:polyisoprenyl-phosphate glycosyltransferase